MSLAIKGFLGKVKSEEWTNKPFVAFDTENPENMVKTEWSAAEKIAERLRDNNKMNQLLPVLKAVVLGQKGPLQEGEIDRTKGYASQIAAKLQKE